MLLNLLRNVIAPPHCICCDTSLSLNSERLICEKCQGNLPFVKGKTCNICGVPLYSGYQDYICHDCKHKKFVFAQNVSRFKYKGNIRDSILKMKFGTMQIWIAKELGLELAKTVEENYSDIKFDGIVYVPLSKINYIKRHFNQAEELSLYVSNEINVPIIYNALSKIRNTKTQSELKMKDRPLNVKDAYKVLKHDEVAGKTLLLIDDVFTTGSTINECAKVLKKSGALAIYTATVAITTYE